MDNLTHSLLGAALAQCAMPEEASRPRRRLFLAAGIVAANVPDLDLLYFGITPPPLGYLLHHRGHTHTFAAVLPLAALVGLLVAAIPAARRAAAGAHLRLAGLLLAGVLSHVPLDFGNSYGVHPFHPIDPRWFYGDAVFILEPWLWLLLGAPLLLRPLRPRTRGTIGLLSACALLAALYGLSAAARRAVRQQLAPVANGRLLDVILTANPVQPLCWAAITVEKDEPRGTFTVRRGMLSLRPDWVAPVRCPLSRLAGAASVPAETEAMAWIDVIHQPLAPLRERVAADCRTRAWMQFGRAPVVRDGVIFDLRFERGGADNFTAMPLPEGAEERSCPPYLTSWGLPRADLLAPGP